MGQSPRQGLGVGTNGADLVSPPLVSLLIINWNYGTYIGATIDSIKSQDYPAIEVIVVDNGSTDDSRDVIAKHAGDDPRFRVVHLDENLGQLGAYFHALSSQAASSLPSSTPMTFCFRASSRRMYKCISRCLRASR